MRTILILLASSVIAQGAFFNPWTDNGELVTSNRTSISTDITNEITISYWCTKIASSPGGGRTIGKPGGSLAGQFDIKDSGGGLKKMDFDCDNNAGGSASWRSTASFDNTNIWTFWAITYRYADTNSFRLYSNGVQMAGVWINTPTNSPPTTINSVMFLGSIGTGGRWNGSYSDFAIWSNRLSADQINLIYKSHVKGIQKQINPTALKAYYPLDTWPDQKQHTAFTIYPERGSYGHTSNSAYPRIINSHAGFGDAERVSSYPPNE